MTEILLNAVLNLFAIQASMLGAQASASVRARLERYLAQHLHLSSYDEYLSLYDTALDLHELSDDASRLEHARSVAAGLKSLLPRLEQYVFVLRYLESVAGMESDKAARAVAEVVAAELSIPAPQLDEMHVLCTTPFDASRLTDNFLTSAAPDGECACRRLERPDFEGRLTVLGLREVGVRFVVSGPDAPVSLDSITLTALSPHLLQPGGILRDVRGNRIYSTEIDSLLLEDADAGRLVFEGEHLQFRYPGTDVGLHDFSFRQKGGALVGIMGVSGAGKSTLLGILNGQRRPDSGRVLINGIDLHAEPHRLEGVIGYVPQDDLLFEDLTVFDNLSFNAALCLAHLDPDERAKRVDGMLDELQQLATRDLKVGSPLDKTISGGQRKRLNIALELIREPPILFVDEPTSGLSSSDSENVMALLKAQAAKGKLVIVVIHQPSSRIYRMFDTLWILDRGGRPIYDGNPLDAIVHFRSEMHQAGMEEYACPGCGQVNPEQIFEIIEARAVGEDGQYGRERMVSPEAWHERYLELRAKHPPAPLQEEDEGPVERRLWRPGLAGQFATFFMRNLKGRLNNLQYLLVNLLEPPLLAFLAALICLGAWGGEYVFQDNENLATYFFISVIVALFLGMSVSAEEINRDRKILKREEFLHLSWPCYIASKAVYLLLVAALQMALFVVIGNTILEIPDMYWSTWLVLFGCAAVSSILGLNVSATLRSAVTIYILIPLLLVPQMMLGGAVVPLDDLLHKDAGHRRTPLVANIMPSRWGYEALVVEQFLQNDSTRNFLPHLLVEQQYGYLASYHLPEMRALADYPLLEDATENPERAARKLAALRTEMGLLSERTGLPLSDVPMERIEPGAYDAEVRNAVKRYLKETSALFSQRRDEAREAIRAVKEELRAGLGDQGLEALERANANSDIGNKAMNRLGLEYVRLSGDRLVQVAAPIARTPESVLGGAPLFSAVKRLGPWTVGTFAFNLAVLWLMAGVLYAALYVRLLPRLVRLARRAAAMARRRA